MSVCMSVREREREKERDRDREREREGFFLCVCVWEGGGFKGNAGNVPYVEIEHMTTREDIIHSFSNVIITFH